ncbi:hypothetical protein RHMOL_Rhmol12G0127100 [Rhododendron molle]|uniref:Uncharacterized protein n=1 Tax=Rhododendron molle TaxID=49168 RepID=A0ACC0LJ02_RHOML|nr:hypothetical protein RHMOL_Rhmol12G0127100 [Rhododendron molle]
MAMPRSGGVYTSDPPPLRRTTTPRLFSLSAPPIHRRCAAPPHRLSSSSTASPSDMRCSPSCTRAVLGAEPACHPDFSRYTGTMDVFYKVVRQEGLARLWGSMNASLALAVPTVGCDFTEICLEMSQLWVMSLIGKLLN